MKNNDKSRQIAYDSYDPRFGHNDPMKSLLREAVEKIRTSNQAANNQHQSEKNHQSDTTHTTHKSK